MDDSEAIAAFQDRAQPAFQILFERHAAHVYRTAYLILLQADLAEDVAQETFLALFRQLPRLEPGPVGPWLDRVAARLSLNVRRRSREVPLGIREHQTASGSPGADEAAEADEDRRAVQRLLGSLTPRQRAMVVMRFYGDYRFADIAKALGCRSGTVRATVHQALQHLRQSMLPADPPRAGGLCAVPGCRRSLEVE